ncbi:glycosyltransferase family 2 protein [Patescibacteria group bacterium]|nr:MAG: glycosyltransferase family 2 protein [Patescibacteria group bacterium]
MAGPRQRRWLTDSMSYRHHPLYRLLEIFPGATVWLALILAVVLSFTAPVFAIVFILLFDLFWFLRVLLFVYYLVIAWCKYRRTAAVDWEARLQNLPRAGELRHVIFLPTYTEELAVIRATLRSLAAVRYPQNQLIVVLAGEERDGDRFLKNAELLSREFDGKFGELLVTLHPSGLSGEIPGKGSNLNWAGRLVQEYLDRRGIAYERVVASAFDVDTIVHPQYFAYLSWLYLTQPEPLRASYQPIALYANNIWDSPAAVRVAAFGTTFWLMAELARRDNIVTFSSHSMPFRALADVGFWETDVVSEDSRIFFQCLRHYHGRYRVVPMYLPVSMDTVGVGEHWQSLRQLYKQVRRWAWGVEHFPYLAWHFAADRRSPRALRLRVLWREWEGRFSWATAPIIMFLLGRLPLYAASRAQSDLALVNEAPFALEWLMRLAMIGVLVSALFSFTLLPPRPERSGRRGFLFMALQWLLLPITFVLFGSIPALDAQTRLMLGKYLGFNVSVKRRTELAPAVS